MSDSRLLLCTDMDRTLIPNGSQPESEGARELFARFCARPGVMLAYVTGRHKALVEDALAQYQLPVPNYAITDVGTKIYRINGDQWQAVEEWEREIDSDWNGWSHAALPELMDGFAELRLQEDSKQNTHKLSYYVSLDADVVALLEQVGERLHDKGINASLIWSIDEPAGIGLLDVLPRNATKLHAIDFLRQLLGYGVGEIVFAGDSGNDLPVMASEIPSVLVANASSEVRAEAVAQAVNNAHGDALYLAAGRYLGMNGNYAAGILEGVWHFAPAFRDTLQAESMQ